MKSKKTCRVYLAIILIFMVLCSFFAVNGSGIGIFKEPLANQLKQGLDLKGGAFVVYEANTDKTGEELAKVIDETIEVFRRRVDYMGLTEPVIVKEGENRIRVELPGVTDVEQALDAIGKTAVLQFVMPDGEVVATGSDVDDAALAYDQNGRPIVSLKFNSEGAKKFGDATSKLAPKKEQLAIVLDGEVISSPVVESAITNGAAQITGNFTDESANELANLIRAGALPEEFKEVQSSIITATLGVDALNKAVLGGGIGILLVMIFMAFYYRIFGIAADIALVFYMLIVGYVYVLFGATITLPGIAALILSVGMAVDANVITFERIKEEVQAGKSVRVSVDHGYKKSLSTILDSQITTFFAGIVLYYFGTGPIKGFALTLMIGIFASLLTGQVITRIILKSIIGSFDIRSNFVLGIKEKREILKNVDFKKIFKFAPIVSLGFIVIGLVFAGVAGFNQGLDFSGGTVISIDLNKNIPIEEIKEITSTVDENMQINYIGEDKSTIELRTQQDLDNQKRTDLFNEFKEKYSLEDSDYISSEQIGPSIGAEIKNNAIMSTVIATICMLIYISFRFKFSYGLAAIIALVHDVLFVLAVYSIFRVPLNSPFVAAILTVVGYSVNDTIVIFDRIRENMKNAKRNSEYDMAVLSIKQTLARSLNTSITTLIAILALYILGVDSIKEFTFPLIMGIAVGAYSSIFIAGPLWIIIAKKMKNIEKKKMNA